MDVPDSDPDRHEQPGDAPATHDDSTDRGTTDRWLADGPVLDARLPRDVRASLERLLGGASVATLGDWVDGVRHHTGGSIAVEELCHASEETPHWGEMDGVRYHFACFYDAVLLSALAEQPVDIRTESPDGTVVEARAVGTTELTVSPETAAFSFGVDETAASSSGGDPSLTDVYAAVCPYVRAFPDRDAYERWAATVPAATVAMPLAGATAVAAELVE